MNNEPSFNIEGSMILSGTGSGAEIKDGTFDYDTRETTFSLSFIQPDSSDLSFTGAENLDVEVKLVKDGRVIDRYSENIEKLPLGEEQTIDFNFGKKPAGVYKLNAGISFECTFVTLNCQNSDSISTQIDVPKTGVTG